MYISWAWSRFSCSPLQSKFWRSSPLISIICISNIGMLNLSYFPKTHRFRFAVWGCPSRHHLHPHTCRSPRTSISSSPWWRRHHHHTPLSLATLHHPPSSATSIHNKIYGLGELFGHRKTHTRGWRWGSSSIRHKISHTTQPILLLLGLREVHCIPSLLLTTPIEIISLFG